MRRRFSAIFAAVAISVLCVDIIAYAESETIFGKLKGVFAATSSPREILASYLEAKRKGDFASAYALLSSEDQAARPKDKFVSLESESHAMFRAVTALIEQNISEVTSDDKRITATVVTKHPDPMAIFGVVLGATLAGDKKESEKVLADKLAGGGVPMTTTTSKVVMVKEGNEWRVYEGYRLKDQIERLTADAVRFEKEKRFDAAIKTYDELLTLKNDAVGATSDLSGKRESAVAKREEAKRKLAQANADAAYMSNIKLYDFKARYYDTFLEKRVPGVTFKIKNEGERTLNRVEVTVYFKDAKGDVISEEAYYPVSTASILGNNKPLRPGYIWQIERGNFYMAKSVPSEWVEGSAFARITSIEIAE